MFTQGRCKKCNVRIQWKSSYMRLADAYCPWCGTKLSRTTHLFKGPMHYKEPIRKGGK